MIHLAGWTSNRPRPLEARLVPLLPLIVMFRNQPSNGSTVECMAEVAVVSPGGHAEWTMLPGKGGRCTLAEMKPGQRGHGLGLGLWTGALPQDRDLLDFTLASTHSFSLIMVFSGTSYKGSVQLHMDQMSFTEEKTV